MEGTADIREVEDAAEGAPSLSGSARSDPRRGARLFVGRPETSPTARANPSRLRHHPPVSHRDSTGEAQVLHGLDAAFLSGASEGARPVRPNPPPDFKPPARGCRDFPRLTPASVLRSPRASRDRRRTSTEYPPVSSCPPGPRRRPPRTPPPPPPPRAPSASRSPPSAWRFASTQPPDALARAPGILLHAARLRLGERPHPGPTHRRRHPSRPTPRRAPRTTGGWRSSARPVSSPREPPSSSTGGSSCPTRASSKSSPRTTPRKPPPRSRLPRDDSNTPPHPPARSERPPPRVFSCRWRRGDPGEMRIERGYGGEVYGDGAGAGDGGTEAETET